jgi:hypothetical protein
MASVKLSFETGVRVRLLKLLTEIKVPPEILEHGF